MHSYIYIDESGCLGFDFSKQGTSKYFTICLVVFKSKHQRDMAEYAIKKTLKRKLNHKKSKRQVDEIKGASTTVSVKKYLLKQIELQSGVFEVYGITFNKTNVRPDLQFNKDRLYNYIVRILLDQLNLNALGRQINVVLDKCKTQKQIKHCNNYLLSQLQGRLELDVQVNIEHRESHLDHPLQIADIAANALQRKTEYGNGDTFSLFENFIEYYDIYFNG